MQKTEKLHELNRKPMHDSHLLLLSRAPVQGEERWRGGRVEGDEGQGGMGGRVEESVGRCLRNNADKERESKEKEKESQRHWKSMKTEKNGWGERAGKRK